MEKKMKQKKTIMATVFISLMGLFVLIIVLGVYGQIKMEQQKEAIDGLEKKIEMLTHKDDLELKFQTRKDNMVQWVIKRNNWKNPLHRAEIEAIVEMAERGFNGPLILALSKIESAFDKNAVSSKDCIGLMQINPIHCKRFGLKREDLFSPAINIWVAGELLKGWKINPINPDYNFLATKYFGVCSKKYVKKIKSTHEELLRECE